MENVRLDTTQNRNLTFLKIFGIALAMLCGMHFLFAEKNPDLNAHKEEPAKVKTCKMQTQSTPQNEQARSL